MASTSVEETVAPDDAIADSRRALVARVIGSSIFLKTERLSGFLSSICELALSGRAHEINEHSIGTTVFGRSPHYDSTVDGIVRTQASRLRQKLDLYFNGEGADEPIRIVIPRGSYVPLFEPAPGALPQPIETPPLTLPLEAPVTPSRFPIYIWSASICLALALITVLLSHAGILTLSLHGRPQAHPLWSEIFTPGRATLAVPGDSGSVMRQGIINRNMGLADYLSSDHGMANTTSSAAIRAEADDFGGRRYTTIVDLEIVHDLDQIALSGRGKLELRYARELTTNDLKRGNVILIGAPEANPWVELFERNMNFVFSHDRDHRVMSVVNRSPTGSEPHQWDSRYTDAQRRVFGVVAYLPNLSGNGNVLIVEGTSMAGTDSAWDFVSDDSQLLPFLKQIRGSDRSVPHFEVVLGTNNFNGSAAKTAVLAWRTSR
ncbi:hypothetical protein HNQ77_000929 [Silvibacterium bohemicum]|uniref:Uncharacterized protein n=1 Tax=Silvibacterium bohemicum TaxID=1577686 RepID=A0A841JRE4_9BACT|nr:hypothetical protein [Silvibacterium bohemicum]MBB6142985.1 hypothetical protein [Silvibacterium bohemicum]